MDDNQIIKFTIVSDVSNAVSGLSTIHQKLKEIQESKAGLSISKSFEDAPMKSFANSYSRVISDMTRQAEGFYLSWQKNGNVADLANYKTLIPQIQQLSREQNAFNKSLKNTGGAFQNIGDAFSKHIGWVATGIGVGSAIGGVISGIQDISKLETEFNQLKTVLPEIEGNQQTFNTAMKDSFVLAEKYGTKIEQVTESLRLMGRGYHELSTSEKLAETAVKLSVADNFDPQTATKSIEAVVGAYGKQGEAVTFATKVMDSMTKVSHTSQISANDLAESLLRSAAAAKTVGVSFDELNAMTAVIARNTGLSGQTIGDGLKSILNSIHSDKAIKDLQEIGVEVYKVGNDGQKEFRKISDVLMDVSIKAKSTNQNFEELFRNLAGGKFQITKLSSLLGDPNEYLRVLGNSINSSGFTDKQLEIQMNTIQRKSATLKASFEELLTTGGNQSGFSSSLKSILDTLNQILKGLNNINPLVWSTIGGITKFAAAFVTLRTAVNFAESSYVLLRSTIITTRTAQEALNVATVANPFASLAKLIVLAGTALATYAYFAGEAVTAQEKANQAADNAITAKSSEIEMTKQQTAYMEVLGNTYVGLQAALQQVATDEEKAAEIKKAMGTVSEQLAQIVGKEAADRILASDDIKGAITQEQEVHNEKVTAMQKDLDNLRKDQIKLMNETIAASNDRIGAINNEAISTDKAADAIAISLGKIQSLWYRYYKSKAEFMGQQAEQIQKEADSGDLKKAWKLAGIPTDNMDANVQDTVSSFKQQQADYNAQAKAISDSAIEAENERKRAAYGTLGGLYTPVGAYNTTPTSTGEVSEGTPKGKNKGNNNGSKYAPDRQDQIEKLWANHDVNHILSQAKISADQYQEALARLQVQQDLTGETAELDAQKFKLMTDRTAELATETDTLTKKRDEFQQKANDLVAGNADMVTALNEKKQSWADLTKDEKKDFIHDYFQGTADEKLGINYLDMADKLDVKIADNNKTSSGINNDIRKDKKSSLASVYSRNMQGLDEDEQLATYALGTKATEEQKRMVQLNSEVLKLAEAERRLREIKKNDHSDEELKKQEVVVEGLKVKVLELKDVWQKFGEEAYNALDQILIQGKSIGSVFKDLWKQMASSALKALITRKPVENGGLLGSILGLFGHNAEGSIGDQEQLSWIREGNKKEAVIPMENPAYGEPLWFETGKQMGLIKNSNGIEPNFKNPDLGKQSININVQQQQNHTEELQTANKLMRQQNAMLVEMLQNGNGGNIMVMPVAPSAEQVFAILEQNPSALYNILGKGNSKGFR